MRAAILVALKVLGCWSPQWNRWAEGWVYGKHRSDKPAREVNEMLVKALTEARITLDIVTSNPITAYELGMARRALTWADAALTAAKAKEVK